MKKLSLLLLAAALVGCANNATSSETVTPSAAPTVEATSDTFTSASLNKYFYQDSALTGEELWEVLASYQAAIGWRKLLCFRFSR